LTRYALQNGCFHFSSFRCQLQPHLDLKRLRDVPGNYVTLWNARVALAAHLVQFQCAIEGSAMKIFLLMVAALIVSAVLGFQQLSGLDHLPDGNRFLLIGGYIALAAAALGAIACLCLLSKNHRNLKSYLKVLVVLGALSSLGQCGHWYTKFMGPSHTVTNKAGNVTVEVPSDWARHDTLAPSTDLFVADWAGTRSLGIKLGDALGDVDQQAELNATYQEVRGRLASAFGPPIDRVACGNLCVGDVYAAVADGKSMHALSVIKISCGRLMMVQGNYMVSPDARTPDFTDKRQQAIRVIQSASCSVP
jgi:hypothetical protein